MVGRVVPGRGARRWKLRCSTHACIEIRKGFAWRNAVLQSRALHSAALALDPGRTCLITRVPDAAGYPESVSECRPHAGRSGHCVPSDAEVSSRRVDWINAGRAGSSELLNDSESSELGRLLSRARFLSPLPATRRNGETLRAGRTHRDCSVVCTVVR